MACPAWLLRVRDDLLKKEFIPIKVLFLLIYGASMAMFPFLTLQARSLGITEQELGIVYGFNPVVAILGPPATGIIADKIGNFKLMLSVCMAASGCAALLFSAVPPGRITHHLPPVLPLTLTPPAAATLTLPHPLTCHIRPALSLTLTNFTVCDRWDLGEDEVVVVEGQTVTLPDNTTLLHLSNHSTLLHLSTNSTLHDAPLTFNSSLILQTKSVGKDDVAITLVKYDVESGGREEGQEECRLECVVSTLDLCTNTVTIQNLDPKLTFWSYFLVRIINTLTLATSFTLFDGAAMALLKEHKGEYGLQRLYGSLGAVVLTPLSGVLIDIYSHQHGTQDYRPAFFLYCGLKLAASLVILMVNLDFRHGSNRVVKDFKFLLQQPEIIAFITVMLLSGTVYGVLEIFLFWLLQDLGASKMLMGVTVTVGSLAGIPLLVAADTIISRLGHVNTIILGFAFYIVRMLGYSFLTNPWWSMPFEALECFTVSLMSTAAVSYAVVLSTPATLATLQGVYGGIYYGVGRGLGSLLGGFLMGPIGIRNIFRLMALIAAVTSIGYFVINRLCFHQLDKERRKKAKEAEGEEGQVTKVEEEAEGREEPEKKVEGKKDRKRELEEGQGICNGNIDTGKLDEQSVENENKKEKEISEMEGSTGDGSAEKASVRNGSSKRKSSVGKGSTKKDNTDNKEQYNEAFEED